MDIITRNHIEDLLTPNKGKCASIYMPTHRVGAEIQQDAIRFKNLLGKAEELLRQQKVNANTRETILRTGRELLDDTLFWQHQSDALAFFADPGSSRCYRLALEPGEIVVVADRFHLKPLMTLLNGDGRFYILALSQKNVKLLQGTKFSVNEVDLEQAPHNLAEALQFDNPERQLQYHTGTAQVGGGDRAAIFHGQGKGANIDNAEKKKNILRFFQQLNRAIIQLLPDTNSPLVLAGVDYLLPLYREANSYPNLVPKGITGNPEDLSVEQLHSKAWQILQPQFQKAQKDASQRYRQFAGTGRASNDLNEVVRASLDSRIDVLLLPSDHEVWGRFNSETRDIEVHQLPQAGDEDLLDLAAIETFVHGGTVFTLGREDIPDSPDVAAIMRY